MSRPVLITAGSTRNPIDAMRYISAYATGRTGVAIGEELSSDHTVHLLGSPEAGLRAGTLSFEPFSTTRDLMARMAEWMGANPGAVVVHSAAVGDYEAEPEVGKIASNQAELVVRLTRAPKIIDHLKRWDPNCLLVSFKAAGPQTDAEALVATCRRQIERTGSDLVFGNVIGSIETTATLVDRLGSETFADRRDAMRALCARVRRA